MSEQTVGVDQAMARVKSGMKVVTAMAAAEPQSFFSAFHRFAPELQDVTVFCSNPSQSYPCFEMPDRMDGVDYEVMFLTRAIRDLQGQGTVHYIPQHLSQWTRNIFRNHSINVFWGSCSPVDDRGFVSLGPSSCYEPEIIRQAGTIILEANPNIPVTFGATHVPIDSVDHFIESDGELPGVPPSKINDTDRAVASHVAHYVEDGCTIQLGIGGIPNAVAEALRDRVDLGVHTEMVNDAMMDLFQKGVITGRKKTLWPGKMVGSFVFGRRELYDFVHRNPVVELQPSSVVNDPYRIGRNHRMISINTAVEIDLTGQVCSESVGHQELSGVGGATDTHIGAQRSEGGRGIVAIHSQTGRGTSKIVSELKPGAKISISRNDVDTVVTEFGRAELVGKNVEQRAQALISIAHPDHRDGLTESARAAGYLGRI